MTFEKFETLVVYFAIITQYKKVTVNALVSVTRNCNLILTTKKFMSSYVGEMEICFLYRVLMK